MVAAAVATAGTMTDDERACRALEIYRSSLRDRLEPEMNGYHVAVNVEDGDFEVAPSVEEAVRLLDRRHPEAVFVLMEVGRPLMDWPWGGEHVSLGQP